MGDYAFSLPTLLVLAPAAGGLIAMSMVTRRAAGVVSILTFATQVVLLILGARELSAFRDLKGAGQLAGCDDRGSGSGVVLAQCANWIEPLHIQWQVAVGWATLALVALVTLVTFCATMFSWWADRPRPAALIGLLWLTAAPLICLFVARDLALFYICFELMLVPLLVLVGVWGGENRVRATLSMFIYTMFGSLLMLVSVIGVGVQAGSFDLVELSARIEAGSLTLHSWILPLFLLAFVVKAPLPPFHGWLPLTYREAPAEVAAVLSGLVSKAAFFGMFAIVLPLFPGQLAGGWGTALTILSVIGLLYGSLAAFRQPDPRGVVAYSSLAQMGLIFLGLSVYLHNGGAQGVSGAYLQTINHGLVSVLLFLLIGIIEVRSGERLFSRLGGLASGRPILASIALAAILITLAVPGASTFGAELLVMAGAFRGAVAGPFIATLVGLAVVLAAMYALRLLSGMTQTPGLVPVSMDTADTDFESTDAHRADVAAVTAEVAAHDHMAAVAGVAASPHAAVDIRFGGDLRARELVILGPLLAALLLLSAWPNIMHRAVNEPPVPVRVGEAAPPTHASPMVQEQP